MIPSELLKQGPLLDRSPDAVCLLDGDRLAYVNPKFTEIFGFPSHEICRPEFDLSALIQGESRALFMDWIRNLKKNQAGRSRFEFEAVTRTGRNISVETTVSYFHHNEKLVALGLMRDITEKRQNEWSLRRLISCFTDFSSDSGRNIAMIVESIGEILSADCVLYNRKEGDLLVTQHGWKMPESMPRFDSGEGRVCFSTIEGDREEPVLFESLLMSPYAETEPLARKFGYQTYLGCPVKLNGKTVASLCAVFTREKPLGEFQIQLLKIAAKACSAEEDRRFARNEIYESEWKYRQLVELAREGIWVFDSDIRTQFVNPRLTEILGYAAEEVIGRSPFDLVAEPYIEIVYGFLDIISSGSREQIDAELIRKDGTRIIVYMSGSAIHDDNGNIKGILAVISDITERKNAETALRQAEEKYRGIFENAMEGIFQCTMDGRLTTANPALAHMLGYDTPDELKSCISDIWSQVYADPDSVSTLDKKLKTSGRVSGYECRFKNRGGGFLSVSESIRIVRDSQGNPLFYEGIVEDITLRIKAEQEKKRLEEQFLQAQKMEAVGTLAGGIAHDFNNLLMGIEGYASLMLMDLDPGHPHYHKLKSIEEQVQSGANLSKQLLGFARHGKYEVMTVPVNDVVSGTADMFGRTKKQLNIGLDLCEGGAAVEADRSQIEQVLLNLLVNAWQAMPGGGELTIKTEITELNDASGLRFDLNPGQYVRMSVADKGVGMDANTRKRIFEPFFTTKEMGRGTGLGLASAYGIVKGHGGIIDVESEPGHGSVFHVYLPLSGKPVTAVKTGAGEIQKGRGTILLVDDESVILNVGKEILEALGFRVLISESGMDAIKIYRNSWRDIDLVILDMIMPGMGGGEVFDELKKTNQDVRVILSSGYSLSGRPAKILARGCKAFIQKPFGIQELSGKIKEILEND